MAETNVFFLVKEGDPGRARYAHLARSGSQPYHSLGFILTARGVSHNGMMRNVISHI